MGLFSEISTIERNAAVHAVSIKAILRRAGFATSNWARWKKGKTSPSLKNWEVVVAAASSLFNEAKTSSPDSTAGRAAGSSQHPIPDTAVSQRPDAECALDQSGVQDSRGVSSSSSQPSSAPAAAHQDS